MTSQCAECGYRFDILDTVRCNTCNDILCARCIAEHLRLENVTNERDDYENKQE